MTDMLHTIFDDSSTRITGI